MTRRIPELAWAAIGVLLAGIACTPPAEPPESAEPPEFPTPEGVSASFLTEESGATLEFETQLSPDELLEFFENELSPSGFVSETPTIEGDSITIPIEHPRDRWRGSILIMPVAEGRDELSVVFVAMTNGHTPPTPSR